MSYIFHPITGSYVDSTTLQTDELRIPNRLFRPNEWVSFSLPNEDPCHRLFGLELELNSLEVNTENYDNVCRQILEVLNQHAKHVHIMRDNSVRNGIEIVFSPMTYNYIMATFDFVDIFELFAKLGLVATHDTGFHIHVGIEHTLRERNLILRLFAISYPLWLEVSRRHIIRLQDRYVSTEYFMMNKKIKRRHCENLQSIHDKRTSYVSFKDLYFENYDTQNRYNAINFMNDNTVEFRIFNGVSESSHFLTVLNFVERFIALVDEISRTRIDEVFDLETYAQRTQSLDLVEKVSNRLKKVPSLYSSGKLHYNYFYLVNSFWYPTIFKYAETGAYIIRKNDYKVYQRYLTLIRMLDASKDYHKINAIKEDLNDFMIGATFEIVHINKDSIGFVPVVSSVHLHTVSKDSVNEKYHILKCINRDFLYPFIND